MAQRADRGRVFGNLKQHKREDLEVPQIFGANQTYLQCMSCEHIADLLAERKFKCPKCGDLYDVEHNFGPIQPSFRDFTERFDQRASVSYRQNGHSSMLRSGVWRFWEWIMPYLPEDQIITLGEGNVPIVPAGRHLREWLGPVDAWMILEGMNPTGSFKDQGGTVMMSTAKAAGIKLLGLASTGDTSAMAAAYASVAGIKCIAVLPKGKVTPAQIAQLGGAAIILLPGTFDDCMAAVLRLIDAGLIFPVNSINPTRIEGHQSTVFLIAQFFNWNLPDWIALPVGNGSNGSSVGKAMRLMKRLGYRDEMSRILGCQSEAAQPLAQSWRITKSQNNTVTVGNWLENYKPLPVGETAATAARIGNPVSYKKVIREIISSSGAMNVVPEAMLNQAVTVCAKDGYFVCPQTGTALAGVKLAVDNGQIAKGSSVVIVSTATGLKFTESAAKSFADAIIEARDCRAETVAEIIKG